MKPHSRSQFDPGTRDSVVRACSVLLLTEYEVELTKVAIKLIFRPHSSWPHVFFSALIYPPKSGRPDLDQMIAPLERFPVVCPAKTINCDSPRTHFTLLDTFPIEDEIPLSCNPLGIGLCLHVSTSCLHHKKCSSGRACCRQCRCLNEQFAPQSQSDDCDGRKG